jgi:arylsulfatase A-like enzyme
MPSGLLRHPIVQAGLSLLALRVVALLAGNLVRPAGSWQTTLAELVVYAGETALVVAAMLLAWKLLPFARVAMTGLCLLILAVLSFLSVSDPILQSIIGERLTPSTLAHFAGPSLFVSDSFWLPVRANWLPIAAALLLLFAYLAWLVRLFLRRGLHPATTPAPWLHLLAIVPVALPLFMLPETVMGISVAAPVEVQFAAELLGTSRTRLPGSEQQAVAELRAALALPPGARWLDDRFPLVYGYDGPAPAAKAERPDIVVVVIESLRGENLRYINPGAAWHVETPNLDRLAREGVVLPRYLSNAFPTGPGYVALSHSAWPHRVSRITDDFGGTRFDGVAERLRTLGYATMHLEAEPNFDRRERWVKGQYADVIDLASLGLPQGDASLVDRAIGWLRDKDAAAPETPRFAVLLTGNPHMPYSWPDEAGVFRFDRAPDENYRRSLAYVDAQLGRLFAFLKRRPRADQTVVVVVGDHANFIDSTASTGLPVNDVSWTGAIITGPERLVGPPRRLDIPASHVDLSPTFQAMAGDRRPTAALGRDLFAREATARRFAVVLRAGGGRLEDGRQSLMLPMHDASRATTGPSFPFDRGAPGSAGSVMTPKGFANIVRTWSHLVETDRVWRGEFLHAGGPAR